MMSLKDEERKIINGLEGVPAETVTKIEEDMAKEESESFKDPEKLIDLFIDKPGEKKEPVKLGEFEN